MSNYNPKGYELLEKFLNNNCLFPEGTELSQKMLLTLYRMIAEGNPVHREVPASRLNIDELGVASVLDELPPSNIVYDDSNRIIGYRGQSQQPSSHQLLAKGISLLA